MRTINTIARDIHKEWKKVYFGAVPYLNALRSLDTCEDNYGCVSGKEVVLYFLVNANTFRGGKAPKLKAELKEHAWIKLSKKEKSLLGASAS